MTHKINNQFVEFSTVNRIITPPVQIDPRWEKLNISTDKFEIKGIYSKDTMEKFKRFLRKKGARLTLENRFRQAQLNGEGVSMKNLFGKKYVKDFKNNFKNEIHLKLLQIGSYMGLVMGIICITSIF